MLLYTAAFAGYLGIVAGSIFFGWSSAALPLLQRKDSPVYLNDDDGAWVASIFMAGCALGPFLPLVITHTIGRKLIMIGAAVPWLAGWMIIAFATTPWEFYVSRFISGLGTGVAFAVTPMYLGEISPAKIRGILLTLIMMSSRFGILFGYSVIPFVTIKMSALFSSVLVVIFVFFFLWLPESPYYLIRRGKYDAAAKSLRLLRGKKQEEINEELHIIESSVKNEIANSGMGWKEILYVPGNRKSLSVGILLGLFQQLSGSQAIMMYAQDIFDDANINLDGKYLTIILGVVQIFSTGLCAFVVDHFGRRPLLLTSTIGSLFATGVVAVYFTLRSIKIDTASVEWLPATGCMLYVVFYSLGLAPLPTAMIGELFPTNIKALGCAITVFFANSTGFIVGKSFQLICDSVGIHVAFWIFTVINIFGIFYSYFCVPETRGKTLQEIQKEMHGIKH